MAVDLSIVIVSWNVAELLRTCLTSILASPGVWIVPPTSTAGERGNAATRGEGGTRIYSIELYVVDNASPDGSATMVREAFPQVHLIASERNLGFTRGNNVALRQCQGRYVLLLNPDTRLVDDALAAMLAYMEAHPEVGVLGPRLCYGDGRSQSSRRRFPTLWTALLESTLLQQWFPRNRWARAYYMADTPDDAIQEVDWVTGACMLVRAEAIRQVGLLDEGFFMYSEELDWCRRMAAAGWRTVYFPRATVIHYEGQSSAQVVPVRHIHFQSSKVRYFAKHHGAWQAEVLRCFLLATYLWQLGEETLKYLLGHKRPLRRARMRAYMQVLRSRLRSAEGGEAS